MNVLIIGSGHGSFEVRGKQLGAAIGARVKSSPSPEDLTWADVVVLIKHAGPKWAGTVRRAGKPVVWDALDFWRQPQDNAYNERDARLMLKGALTLVRPTLFIGATQAMAEAGEGAYLPHHAWPSVYPRPIRERVLTVSYDGTKKYLGKWATLIQKECARRGWLFEINAPDHCSGDILVAFRDGQWDGWMCQQWKSGVKLVNAIAAGRPIITQPSAAFDEIQPIGATVSNERSLGAALDAWAPVARRRVGRSIREYDRSEVAEKYRVILESVLVR